MKSLEEKLGYQFQDKSLLENALTHSSYANEHHAGRAQSNERLEFLGDSVLGMVVADYLYRHFPDLPEGDLTRMRASLVCENSLVVVAGVWDLGAYLKLGKGEESCGGRERPSIRADAVEAVIAAVYLDGGIDLMEKAARAFSEMTGIRFSLHLSIDKRIPSGCGLGGGSSDAASVLRFLNHSFSDPLDDDGILECALSIGSDVPFFASGMPSALCRGRGELLEPAMAPHGARILLFIPPERTATRDAYGRLDAIPRPERHLRTDAELTRQAFPNDFELISPPPPAEVGCFPYFSLTGSGSAWYAILPDTAAPKFDNPGKYAIVSAYII